MMKYSSEVFVASFLILLCLPKSALSNLESQMLKSLQTATRCKKSRTPPTEPILAFSPKRYAQLVALLRTRTNAPTCGRLGSGSFSINEPSTWSFCALGNCVRQKCNCISSYTGPSCSQFGGKCWLIYCFLKSCKKSFQNIHCECNPAHYGKKVLSGDYWYDEGKKESYVAPPSEWSDVLKGDEGAKMSAVLEDMFPSFDNKLVANEKQKQPVVSDKKKQPLANEKQPAKPPEHEETSGKVSNADQIKHEGNANHENEVETHSGNDEEESSDDELEDLEAENEDESSSCLFIPTPMPQIITIFSVTILCRYFS